MFKVGVHTYIWILKMYSMHTVLWESIYPHFVKKTKQNPDLTLITFRPVESKHNLNKTCLTKGSSLKICPEQQQNNHWRLSVRKGL